MTEYTPTTDEVRHMFATAPLGGAQPALPVPALVREFDRWLAQVKDDAWAVGYEEGVQRGIASREGRNGDS